MLWCSYAGGVGAVACARQPFFDEEAFAVLSGKYLLLAVALLALAPAGGGGCGGGGDGSGRWGHGGGGSPGGGGGGGGGFLGGGVVAAAGVVAGGATLKQFETRGPRKVRGRNKTATCTLPHLQIMSQDGER